MDFKQNDSLEVDAILERIKNKLSERHLNNHSDGGSLDLAVGQQQQRYSSPSVKKPLLLDDFENSKIINIPDPNIIPNPFKESESTNAEFYDNINTDIIELTPNMEIHQDIKQNNDENVIDINLSSSEYKLLVEVLSKRFSKAFYITKLQPKIEKWLDINLKDLLASK